MASYDNSYSRFVALTKIMLPLAALALLSTLFLFARGSDPTGNLPFSKVEVDQIVREQRLSAPKFSGVTKDGTSVQISADIARPDTTNPQRMTGEGLSALLQLPDSATVEITAPHGTIDAGAGLVTLSGEVLLATSTGYRVTADALTASLEATSVISPKPVVAEGPIGTLNAGSMDLTLNEAAYHLVFKDRVKLVYDPTKGGRP